MLEKDPEKRITLKEIKTHDWVTGMDKFPLVEEQEENFPSLKILPSE